MIIDYEWAGQVLVSLIFAGITGSILAGAWKLGERLVRFHRRGMSRVRRG
jgi:TRAP-type C4-dicarboxylate transport system permease large subunit